MVLVTTTTVMADELMESVYTLFPDNPEKRCKILERGSERDPPPDYVKVECPGYGDYRVRYSTDEDHGSILALFHRKKKMEWPLVTLPQPEGGLCPQGQAWVTAKQLEWRVTKGQGALAPFALIYRVSCVDLMGSTPVTTEILAVAKVSLDQSCLIGKVVATGNKAANVQARTSADTQARTTKCPTF